MYIHMSMRENPCVIGWRAMCLLSLSFPLNISRKGSSVLSVFSGPLAMVRSYDS